MDRRIGVILIVILVELVFRLVYSTVPLPVSPLLFTMMVRLAEALIILGLAFYLSGVPARSIPREILIGAGVAVAFGAAVVLGDAASRALLEGGALRFLIGRQEVADPVLFFLVVCVIAPFAEELFFRGLFYSWLRQRMPVIVSIVVSALFFAGMHGFIAPVQLAGGLIFAGLYEWRGNVWAPYTVHAAANLGIWVLPWLYPSW
jgi:membrane protease YdiL (CAAX protease family)